MLQSYKGIVLSQQDIKYLHEAYKLSDSEQGSIEDRLVNVKDLVSTKINRKYKRIDDLIL